ncbi:hypothetical protein [Tardiphaga sp. 709]|uniref:hypothetical protein n=1 Tax=Tardiphaga sp. 709 TaxID=3076039 RepID=UPI0028E83BE0|nr:hypothetical protein [Tardiphaga sp. 709]WNV09930.1 hypothetical protein RSO67_01675 [Tardiphaga sp. 709]
MSEIVERVARALELDSYSRPSPTSVTEMFQRQARAAIEAMREPTVGMVAAAFPCEANEAFSHEDKCLGAAVCLKLGGAADVGLLEGEAVKQAAFLARDYRIMINEALK